MTPVAARASTRRLSAAAAAFALSVGLVPPPALAAGPDAGTPAAAARAHPQWSGEDVMREVYARHETFPHVYEEQTMVLTDAAGNRTVRRLRRFTRAESDGSVRFLLVFDEPEEIRGVALLARRDPGGRHHQAVYLPAFGAALKRPGGDGSSGNFLGTDLAVEDLTGDAPGDYRYVRKPDDTLEEVAYFQIEAYPVSREVERRTGYGMRRHMVRQDNLVIARTDYFDRALRFVKRLTRHDLRRVDGQSWRANMIVVQDEQERHQTLLKVDRRIYSPDYVPRAIFEPSFLLGNGHLRLDGRVAGRLPPERGDGS